MTEEKWGGQSTHTYSLRVNESCKSFCAPNFKQFQEQFNTISMNQAAPLQPQPRAHKTHNQRTSKQPAQHSCGSWNCCAAAQAFTRLLCLVPRRLCCFETSSACITMFVTSGDVTKNQSKTVQLTHGGKVQFSQNNFLIKLPIHCNNTDCFWLWIEY